MHRFLRRPPLAAAQAADRNHESERRFKDFAESATDWLWEMGPDLRFTFLTDGVEKSVGLPVSFFLGKSRAEVGDIEHEPELWRSHFDDLRARRPFRDFVYPQKSPTGRIRWISISGKPLFDAGGAFLGYRGVGADITARKQAEAALRESERRFRHFAESASDWFWEMDAELNLTVYSNRTDGSEVDLAMLEAKSRTHLAGQPSGQDEVWRHHRADLEARRPFRDFRYSIADDNGVMHHWRVSGVPVFDKSGTFRGYRGSGRDETEEVEARRRAELAETRLREAIANIAEGFALFDADDRLALHNEAYERFHWQVLDLLKPGVSFEDLYRALAGRGAIVNALGCTEEWLAERIRRHRDPAAPIEGQLSDGRWVRLQEHRTSDGGTVGVWIDITREKTAQLALERARDELEQRVAERTAELARAKKAAEAANLSKTAFLANMSHELRTPLNAIIGFSQVIKDEMFGPHAVSRYAEYARDIHDSGLHLLQLISDLLDVSKIEAGKLDLHEEALNVADCVEAARMMIARHADDKRLRLDAAIAPGLPPLRADERALKQILINLLSNAVKFTPAGGTVSVAAALSDGGHRLIVADTGIGIPADLVPLLGQPFKQLDNVLHREHPGTGLGLALSRSLAELHGGRLRIESTPGQGTSVTVDFPSSRTMAA